MKQLNLCVLRLVQREDRISPYQTEMFRYLYSVQSMNLLGQVRHMTVEIEHLVSFKRCQGQPFIHTINWKDLND